MLASPTDAAAEKFDLTTTVQRVDSLHPGTLETLLARYRLNVDWVATTAAIPGSYWGEREAGLIGDTLYLRADTPLHSALHEASHYLCMDPARRATLHTDARGDDAEEVAVCVLQALLAQQIDGYSPARLFADMDAWGYTFVLGSAQAWFEQDADDGRDWLRRHGLVDHNGELSWRRRGDNAGA